jgi:hypothetical protein
MLKESETELIGNMEDILKYTSKLKERELYLKSFDKELKFSYELILKEKLKIVSLLNNLIEINTDKE